MNDFYFVYTVIGPKRIEYLLNTLHRFSANDNVLVVTNTPELINVSVSCNLRVVHIESLRSDKNRQQEPIACSADNTEYETQREALIRDGHPFPIGILRHAIVWLLQHNITKFVLLDPGCVPVKNIEVIDNLSKIDSYTNVIFLNALQINSLGTLKQFTQSLNCLDIVSAHGIDLDKSTVGHFRPILTLPCEDVKITTLVQSEGWIYGYWFNNQQHLELYYSLWNSMTERAIDSGAMFANIEGSMQSFENVVDTVNNIFLHHFDTLIANHSDIVQHLYTHRWK